MRIGGTRQASTLLVSASHHRDPLEEGFVKTIDMAGKVFGRLTVTHKDPDSPVGEVHWICLCLCGKVHSVYGAFLRKGSVKSCGCLKHDNKASVTHGQASGGNFTGAYVSWTKMRERVLNKNSISYPRYGGRGISIDPSWGDFSTFYRDMGPRPTGGSIERINGDGNYEPSNCRWATAKEQSNNRSINIMVEWRGETKPVSVWADEIGIPRDILYKRIFRKWDTEKAMTQPARTPRYPTAKKQ